MDSARKHSGILAFRHARVVTCTGVDPLDDATVVVEDGVIREVTTGRTQVSPDDEVDCRGRTLMPGLIDAHVHVCSLDVEISRQQRDNPTSLLAYEIGAVIRRTLDQGYTTVRDAAGADWGMKEAVARGLIPGPRMFVSGRALSQTGGHGDGRTRAQDDAGCLCGAHIGMVSSIADGVDEVRRATREQLRRGVDSIKVMASGGVASPTDRLESLQYTREELAAAVEEATHAGSYVLAHAYGADAIRNAVEAGVRSVEHGNFLDAETAALMAARGTFLVPTFVAYEKLYEEGRALGFAAEKLAKLDEVLGVGMESLERAREAGVRIASGSDLLGQLAVHKTRELAIKAKVLGTHDTLVATTRTNAELLGIDDEVGTVEPGKLADLLVVDGDPLADISVLQDLDRIAAIVQAGTFHKRAL
jgi:imidazolonepropionase-like amidohydrolase